MTTSRAAVVVVNYASAPLLEFNAARIVMPLDVKLVVVDCFSNAEERALVVDACSRHGWESVLLDRNAGFGGGTNAGVEAAIEFGARVVIALNPDAWLSTEALAALITEAAEHPRSLVSPRLQTSDGTPWFSGSDLYLDDGSIAGRARREERRGRPRHEWATGACFAMSTDLWHEVGGFDDEYFLYWEDVDLSRRVIDVGGELRMANVVAIHDEGQTHSDATDGARRKSETYYYYNIRNRLMYAAKHLDNDGISRWMRHTTRVSFEIILQGGKSQLVTSITPWRSLWRGIRDGRRLARQSLRR